MARRPARRHGVLVIDKPAGVTSHDVVARIRRLTGERRVGHAGTLDPIATGVLPVCVGQATRLVEHLSEADKAYLTEIVLGVRTDTDDIEGAILHTAPVPALDAPALDSVLAGFRGQIWQAPPAYAAIKVGGRKLYEMARAGQPVAAAARAVTLYRLELLGWRPPTLTLLVECSKGTYIRSLARDIGAVIGCGGYVHQLRRVRSGPFGLGDAWTLEELSARYSDGTWPLLALHPEALVFDRPAIGLSPAATHGWRHGAAAPGPAMEDGQAARVYGADGAFLGTGRYQAATQRWHPHKVLSLEYSDRL